MGAPSRMGYFMVALESNAESSCMALGKRLFGPPRNGFGFLGGVPPEGTELVVGGSDFRCIVFVAANPDRWVAFWSCALDGSPSMGSDYILLDRSFFSESLGVF